MTPDEKDTLTRLKSYGNMSQGDAQEYHRLLNEEAAELAVAPVEPVPPVVLPEPTPPVEVTPIVLPVETVVESAPVVDVPTESETDVTSN